MLQASTWSNNPPSSVAALKVLKMPNQGAGLQPDGTLPLQEFWEAVGFGDPTFVPDFSLIGLEEHDRMMDSFLRSAPDSVFLPPINTLPTGREELLDLFHQVCLNFLSFSMPDRASLLGGGEEFTLNHLLLALAIFRYPDNVGFPDDVNDIATNLGIVLRKMLLEFLNWTNRWSASQIRARLSSRDPTLSANNLIQQGLIELTTRPDICDKESKWLFTMICAVGLLPEIWGIGQSRQTSGSFPADQGPALPPQATSVHPGSTDRAAQLRQNRGASASRVSLSSTSISSRSSATHDAPSIARIHELNYIIRLEKHRILLSANERSLMCKVSDHFYRSILLQYSHYFNGASMSERYNSLILRNPNIMARVVLRCYEHMLRDLKILCGEDSVQ